jgi:hypothetical protein
MLARNSTVNAYDFEGKSINHKQFRIYSRIRLKRHTFTQHIVYIVGYSAVPTNI